MVCFCGLLGWVFVYLFFTGWCFVVGFFGVGCCGFFVFVAQVVTDRVVLYFRPLAMMRRLLSSFKVECFSSVISTAVASRLT